MTTKKPNKELLKQLRQSWSPKRKEMPTQCASCPFRTDNDPEFKAVLDKLVQSNGGGTANTDMARFRIKQDLLQMGGDFICHQSAYDENMDLRDKSEHRQCPGATKFYKDVE